MAVSWIGNLIGLIGIGLGILSFIPPENRILAGAVLISAALVYLLVSISVEVTNLQKNMLHVHENLNIYKELIDIKSSIKTLERENRGI